MQALSGMPISTHVRPVYTSEMHQPNINISLLSSEPRVIEYYFWHTNMDSRSLCPAWRPQSVLRATRDKAMVDLRTRTRILVPEAACLIGVVDETGLLQPGEASVGFKRKKRRRLRI